MKGEKEVKITLNLWTTTLLMSLLVGLFGLIVTHSLEGFAIGFLLCIGIALISMVSYVPFVGIFFYWSLANYFTDWFLTKMEYTEAFSILKWIPLIYCFLVGLITWFIITLFIIIAIIFLVNYLRKL